MGLDEMKQRFEMTGYAIAQIVMVVVVTALLFAVIFRGAVYQVTQGFSIKEDRALIAMTASGFTDVKVTDRDVFFPAWRGCSSDDYVGFWVEAVNSQNNEITAQVCCGYLKACTIRGAE